MVTTVGLYKYLLQKSEAFELAKNTNVMNVKIQKALLSGKYSNYKASKERNYNSIIFTFRWDDFGRFSSNAKRHEGLNARGN